MITQEKIMELRSGLETAFIDGRAVSNIAYKPQFISNLFDSANHAESSEVGEDVHEDVVHHRCHAHCVEGNHAEHDIAGLRD